MSDPSPLRIAVYGPESTGKTTLAEFLAAHFGEPWAPEYVRAFWDARGGVIQAGDLAEIARGQIANEEAAVARARRVMFSDTELLTNVIWADLLFPGECPSWVRDEAEKRCRAFALYLFCETDLPWVYDPQRCFPDEAGRAMCRRVFEQTLLGRNLPHVLIRGSWEERRRQAVDFVNAVLAGRAILGE